MVKRILSYDDIISDDIKEQIVKDYIENFLCVRELSEKYNIKSKDFLRKILGDNLRTISEANKLNHKKCPNNYKHSEETKHKLSEIRRNFLKEHPEKTAWRTKNMSYPEKCFKKFLKENEYDKKYLIIREYSFFPYFIDFAFVNEKFAIEIDGSQHECQERKGKDIQKDNLLKANGWRVLRLTKNIVKTNWVKIKEELDKYLSNKDYTCDDRVGIFTYESKHKKKERDKNGYTEFQRQMFLNNRKVKNRPSPNDLLKLIKSKSFVEVGKMYNVTDNTIRKWCKFYNLPYRRKDIENL